MFKYYYVLIYIILINNIFSISTIDYEFDVIKTKNSSNSTYVPLSIYMDFQILDNYTEINKKEIEFLKKILNDAKSIYESLLSVNIQYHIFIQKNYLSQICQNKNFNNINVIKNYTNLIIFPLISNYTKYKDGFIDYHICNIFSKESKRPIIATLTIAKNILLLNEEHIFAEVLHSLLHILGFRQNAREIAGLNKLCEGFSFGDLEMKKVVKKYIGVFASKISLFKGTFKY